MGLFDKMKSFAGKHGVSVTLMDLDGDPVDAHTMDLDSTSLRGVFRVATEKEATVLMHKVALTVRFPGKKALEVGLFEDATPYAVSPSGARDVPFEISGLHFGQAMQSLGLGEHALVIDKRATLELSVFVDVKGSPVDPRITHSVKVVDDDTPAAAAPGTTAGAAASFSGAAPASFSGAASASASAPPVTGPFAARLHAMVNALRAVPGLEVTKAVVNRPCTDWDIGSLRDRVGFALSSSFLNYYRSANGAVIEWTAGDIRGGFSLRPLHRIEFGPGVFGADYVSAGQSALPFFGGADEFEVRSRLMEFDDAPKNQEYYPSAGLYTHPTHAVDPVVLFPSDAAACMTDAFPMRATSYIEMLMATAGHSEAIRDFPSAYGDKSWTIEWSAAEWGAMGGAANYIKWLQSRGDVLAGYAPAMSKLQDRLATGETSASISPKQWVEHRYGVSYP